MNLDSLKCSPKRAQVDITMKAAKENDAVNMEQHARESIRVARCARELVKKFAVAYREYDDGKDRTLGVACQLSEDILLFEHVTVFIWTKPWHLDRQTAQLM